MKLLKVAGATSEIWQVFVQDSSSTTGAGLTGLAFNSGSLSAYYHRDTDTTATAITLATMTVGTFTSSGFKEIDATNLPGFYQFCPPNAAIAAGAKSCVFMLKGAANMAPLPIEVQLSAVNVDSASAFFAATQKVDVDTIKTNPVVNGGTITFPTNATVASTTGAVGSVTARVTANADQLAGQTVTAAAGVTFPTSIASPTNITAGTITTVTNLTNAPTSGDLTATMKTSVTTAATAATPTAAAVTGNVGGNVVGSIGSLAAQAKTDVQAADAAALLAYGAATADDVTTAEANIEAAIDLVPTGDENADAFLARNVAGGSSSGRTVKQALYRLRNKVVVAAGAATVYEPDDSTSSWTAAVTTTASDPVTAVDPT